MECGSCHEKHNVIFVCEPAIEHYALRFVPVCVPLVGASRLLACADAWSGERQYIVVGGHGAQFAFLGWLHHADHIASHKEVR